MPRKFDSCLPRLLAALAILTPAGWAAHAALLGSYFEISGPDCRFPDVAFGTVDSRYLVVWPDYGATGVFGRFVTGAGVVSGPVFPISDAPFGALYPAVAYNGAANQFLVTWDDAGSRGGVIYGQRVRASDGVLLGPNFPIGSRYGGIRSAVAWSPVSGCYLVVYWGPAPEIDIYGQRVTGDGVLLGSNFNISNDAVFSGYPAVAWGASGNQFLVTWDNEDGNIRGRRVDAATGALVGSTILVTTGGAKDRSCAAYDSVNQRWLVQYNDGANAGFSYDQSGQLINTDGTLNGGPFAIAHTAAFEGDTQFGGDVAFAPGPARFYSSFGTDTGMGAQELLASGGRLGPQAVLGSGYFTSLNNASDPGRHRFLTTWEGQVGGLFKILGQLSAATINPAASLTATPGDSQISLSWQNPGDGHFTGTMIRVKESGYPAGPGDGELVVDQAGGPGASGAYAHSGLANWTTYYYAAFAHDAGPNYAPAVQVAATPRPAVDVVQAADFAGGPDGWALEAWRAGTSGFGTIAWDAAGGNMVATGAGSSNNRDTCTREGGMMTKVISTAGWPSVQVEYDVMAALNAPPAGAVAGGCPVLEGGGEDKLVVYYSTSGVAGPWTAAQILVEGVELPMEWQRRIINLAGVGAAANNPNFALRFQWQFNSAGDTGRLDNIRVLNGAVTAPGPGIGLSAAAFERTVPRGQSPPSDVVRVRNSGGGTLHFIAASGAPWLTVSPSAASSPGPERTLTLAYSAAALPEGDYSATIQVASIGAANSPQTVDVKLHVISPVCFLELFDYYPGGLAVMGAANWSSAAADPLRVEAGELSVVGGAGMVSAAHAVNCAGSSGLVAAQIKIGKGTGGGDFFWNIAFDDPVGNNLARWYGGSSIARGRVGGLITADMPLSGPGAWDDLCLKIDTASNTTEFFFNGVSFGVIPHGAAPSDSVGSVRFERLDRGSAAGDVIHFDHLTLGPPDATPWRLEAARVGGTLELSWPAAGMGASLEATAALGFPSAWATITSPIAVANGRSMYTTTMTSRAAFYRLRRR